jgi:hypothetical protein
MPLQNTSSKHNLTLQTLKKDYNFPSQNLSSTK